MRGGIRGRGRARGGHRGGHRSGRPKARNGRSPHTPEAKEGLSLRAKPAAPPPPAEDHPDTESEDEDEDEEKDESPEEGELQNKLKPYLTLLQSLRAKPDSAAGDDSERKRKRRKLDQELVIGDGGLDAESDIEEEKAEGEEEEEEEEGDEKAGSSDDEEDEDKADPFESHFASPPADFTKHIDAVKKNEWKVHKVVQPAGDIGKMTISVPASSGDAGTAHAEYIGKKVIKGIADLRLKPRLRAPHCEVTHPVQLALAPTVFSYTDLFFTTRTVSNAPHLRHLYVLHTLNHIYKTRDRVLKNNAKLSKHHLSSTLPPDQDQDLDLPPLRDQGFTRPKVLILLPTRHHAFQVINLIASLASPDQQSHRHRLDAEFGFDPTAERIPATKSADFRDLFEGNHDDLFRIGIKFTRKTIKFFSSFYNSDIILASPLGLRMAIGSTPEESAFTNGAVAANNKKHKSKSKKAKAGQDYDFLSSLEIIVIDHLTPMLMQNPAHLTFCLEYLNLLPKSTHETDFSRVREWYLDSHSQYFRQTICLSSCQIPTLNTLFTNHSRNALSGRVLTRPVSFPGVIADVSNLSLSFPPGTKIPQIFHRFPSSSPQTDPDTRFTFFTTHILPTLIAPPPRAPQRGILIFIPSYFDFVRVRNHLDSPSFLTPVSFGCVSEETPLPDVARARSHFASGRWRVLLYSGRAHHFRRYVIRGCRVVAMYGLGGGEGEAPEGTYREVVMVFSKWDALALERVVGTERVGKMVGGRGDVFEFM
ncbi:hypothetical protein BDZ91DRAFT_701085 [Kalaharituber pfeilii]|nr:hypothetical protein BDZ91DRAFT_701085 [Kalaharituber pfeilii]